MNGSPICNHTEFLEKAIAYTREGVVEDLGHEDGQEPKPRCKWPVNGILALHNDVDPDHFAQVGHNFSSGAAAKLVSYFQAQN